MGLINCPINKNLLGRKKIGVTEFLAEKCKVKKNSEVMFLRNKKISESPLTTHLDLKDVSKKINTKIIVIKIKTIDLLSKSFGISMKNNTIIKSEPDESLGVDATIILGKDIHAYTKIFDYISSEN